MISWSTRGAWFADNWLAHVNDVTWHQAQAQKIRTQIHFGWVCVPVHSGATVQPWIQTHDVNAVLKLYRDVGLVVMAWGGCSTDAVGSAAAASWVVQNYPVFRGYIADIEYNFRKGTGVYENSKTFVAEFAKRMTRTDVLKGVTTEGAYAPPNLVGDYYDFPAWYRNGWHYFPQAYQNGFSYLNVPWCVKSAQERYWMTSMIHPIVGISPWAGQPNIGTIQMYKADLLMSPTTGWSVWEGDDMTTEDLIAAASIPA